MKSFSFIFEVCFKMITGISCGNFKEKKSIKTLEGLTILLYDDYRYTMRHFKSSNTPNLAHAP